MVSIKVKQVLHSQSQSKMEKFVIKGPSNNINGIVNISGAKNSCLPLMASSILFKNEVFLKNVPFVNDVFTMIKLLTSLG